MSISIDVHNAEILAVTTICSVTHVILVAIDGYDRVRRALTRKRRGNASQKRKKGSRSSAKRRPKKRSNSPSRMRTASRYAGRMSGQKPNPEYDDDAAADQRVKDQIRRDIDKHVPTEEEIEEQAERNQKNKGE